MYKRLLSLSIAMLLLGLSVFAFPVTAIEESTANDDEGTSAVEQEEIYTSYSESSTTNLDFSAERLTGESQEGSRATTSTIEDGVYAFHNLGNTTMWMDTQHDSDEVGYHMQQYAYTSSPTTTFSRGGLFKITSVASGRYVIRLMTNNLLTFELTSGGVITKEIPADDEDVAAADTFYIESAETGYYIRSYSGNFVITANTSSSSGSSGAPNSYLTRVKKTLALSTAQWDLIRYTDVHTGGYTIYYPTYWDSTGLIAGKETNASVTVWSTRPGVNTPYMSVATSSALYASDQWYEAESAIYITPHDEGTLNLNIQILESESSDAKYSFAQTYSIGLPIEEGLYYIKNAHNSKIMDIEGPSMSDGAYIQQYAFSASRQSKWELVHFKDGYYYIQSNYSDKYVGADTSENSIKQYTSQLSDLRRWKFEETDNGNYRISNCSTQNVISASSAYIGNGVNLVHTAYTDDTDMKDEWELCPVDTYAHRTISLRIMYDSSLLEVYTEEEIRGLYEMVANSFMEYYNLGINLVNVQLNSALNCSSACQASDYDAKCTLDCGAYENCPDVHHRSSRRLLRLSGSDDYYTMRIVRYRICNVKLDDEGNALSHYGINGQSYYKGNSTIVSYASDDIIRTMTHELSHNLGAEDSKCALNEGCVMNAEANSAWCSICYETVRDYLWGEEP